MFASQSLLRSVSALGSHCHGLIQTPDNPRVVIGGLRRSCAMCLYNIYINERGFAKCGGVNQDRGAGDVFYFVFFLILKPLIQFNKLSCISSWRAEPFFFVFPVCSLKPTVKTTVSTLVAADFISHSTVKSSTGQ